MGGQFFPPTLNGVPKMREWLADRAHSHQQESGAHHRRSTKFPRTGRKAKATIHNGTWEGECKARFDTESSRTPSKIWEWHHKRGQGVSKKNDKFSKRGSWI